ncbi:MAG TPA: TetR family transcriptional regulator [Nonomuraea sp.]|uniref:TetR/AcrR family transcriptional regulator n=1 Tax=Nonomuraea sp. NPDC049649 TaxID=3155776 RepID=UPI002C0699EB|nr:TetR family transcriptional regulator [Nonomuraea sp.]
MAAVPTRRRLLDAAVPLIVEAGWGGVSTRLVAERAGVAPGVVHYHFSSVTDLLTEAATEVTGRLLEEFARGLARQADLADGVRWMVAELGRYPGTDPASLLGVELYLAATRLPELRERLRGQVLGFRAAVAGWLRERGYAGDADAAAAVLAAALDGVVLHRAIDPGLDPDLLAGPLTALLGSR